jgi:hypothetical protein
MSLDDYDDMAARPRSPCGDISGSGRGFKGTQEAAIMPGTDLAPEGLEPGSRSVTAGVLAGLCSSAAQSAQQQLSCGIREFLG